MFDKDNKNLIFAKAFKEQKIQAIQATWKFSYKILRFLSMPDPNNPDKINQNLHKIFNSKNFEQKLANAGIKTDEFYKKAFKIQTKKDKQKEVKIWVIDFDYIDKVLQKIYKEEIYQADPTINKANHVAYEYTHSHNINIPQSVEKIVNDFNQKINSKAKNLLGVKFDYKSYLAAIAEIESGWNYKAVNKKTQALWKYQFMRYTLQDYITQICPEQNCKTEQIKQNFLNNPALQEKIMWLYTLDHLMGNLVSYLIFSLLYR